MATTELQAKPAVLRATIHIKRKATGLVETYEVVGHVVPDQLPAPEEPQEQPKEP